jgi:hypothetical protein
MARPKPLADFIGPCLGRALAAQGFAASDIVVAWPDIVGERLARVTRPVRIDWPRGGPGRDPEARPEPATLVVRVESAFALEMQHVAPVILDRINAHYGWRCVGRMVLKQGPVRPGKGPERPQPSLSEAERRQVGDAVQGVAEEDLRAALGRLGEAVIGARGPFGPTKA